MNIEIDNINTKVPDITNEKKFRKNKKYSYNQQG